MEFRTQIDGGLIHALLRHCRVQIQVIACGTATEAAIHVPPHRHGERATPRRLRAMDRTRAPQRWSRGGAGLEADHGQNIGHGDLLTDSPEIDPWHQHLRFRPCANREEEPVLFDIGATFPSTPKWSSV